MATASSASRPSSTTWIGVPEVNPSTDVHSSWLAPALGRAERMMLARLAPSHFALPI